MKMHFKYYPFMYFTSSIIKYNKKYLRSKFESKSQTGLIFWDGGSMRQLQTPHVYYLRTHDYVKVNM